MPRKLTLRPIAAWGALALGLALILAVPPALTAAEGDLPTLTISAYDLEDGSLVLKGERTGTISDGVVRLMTVYTDPDGTRIQEEETRYAALSLRLIDYLKVDHRTGLREEMRMEDGEVLLSYRESRNADTDRDTVEWEEPMAYSYTVVALMVLNWDALQAGEDVEFELLVPSRQESVGFRFRVIGEEPVDAQPTSVIQMEPSSFLIRQLVDPLRFYMTLDAAKVLMRYDGRSPVSRPDGEAQDLRFEYRFGEMNAAALTR